MDALRAARVGYRIDYDSLSLFPLFLDSCRVAVPHICADKAINEGTAVITEVSERGSIFELMVENKGAVRVLFLEGEELVGAKQNRVLNATVLVAAHAKTLIPVSCVEQGRWRYLDRRFASGNHCSAKMRRMLKRSVRSSLSTRSGHRADQRKVWQEISRQHDTFKTASPTSAMSDTHDAFRHRIGEFQKELPFVDGAVGLAAAVGNQIESIDLFDASETCRVMWSRLVAGLVLDAIEANDDGKRASSEDVDAVLAKTIGLRWQDVPPVGEGEESRAGNTDLSAFVLTLEGHLIHASVSVFT